MVLFGTVWDTVWLLFSTVWHCLGHCLAPMGTLGHPWTPTGTHGHPPGTVHPLDVTEHEPRARARRGVIETTPGPAPWAGGVPYPCTIGPTRPARPSVLHNRPWKQVPREFVEQTRASLSPPTPLVYPVPVSAFQRVRLNYSCSTRFLRILQNSEEFCRIRKNRRAKE